MELDEILPDGDAEFLAITANETATGIAYAPQEIAEIRRRNPNILLGVDITSAMGAVAFDFSQADAWFSPYKKRLVFRQGLAFLS